MPKKAEEDPLVQRKRRSRERAVLPQGFEEGFQKSAFGGQSLLEALPDLIFLLRQDGIILAYHAPDPSLLYAPPRKFLGQDFRKVLPLALGERLEILFPQVLDAAQVHSLEFPLSLSGKVHHFEARSVRFDQDKILVILRDISIRKELELALKENQEKYRQLVDLAPTGIYEIDFWKQKITRVNDALCEVTGYSREEILALDPRELLTDESKKFFAGRFEKILANHPVSPEVELKIVTKQGQEIWALLKSRFTYENGMLRGATVVAHDISKRKEAERIVQESEGHLRSLMENARDFSIYRLVLDDNNPSGTRVVFVSPSLDDILGTSDRLKFETWFDNIHPDDLKRVKKAQTAACGTLRFDEEMRIFHPQKKEWRWVRVTSTGIVDQDGRTRYINGIIRDITDKKRGEAALQQAHDQLELRVQKRTGQLIQMNEKLKKEIEERKEVEKVLRKSERQLRFLSDRLINAQENERKRVAIELHDELGQSLVGLKFQLSNLVTKMPGNQGELRREIESARNAIDLMTENVRRLSRDLRPSVLEHLGLFDALQWLFGECSSKFPFKITNHIQEDCFSFSKEQEIIIFRIFQEALTNIGKHSQATQVSIDMVAQGKDLVFSIKDDGSGFDLNHVLEGNCAKGGLGLTAMDERARMAGGGLSIRSQKGKGTEIAFTVPAKKSRKKKGAK